jgi:hypothetical protein
VHLLQDEDDDEQPLKAVALDDVEAQRDVLHQSEDVLHQSEDVLHQSEDVLHQSEKAAALEEEDVDKLPNPSFFQFFILTNCKLSLVRQLQ